MEVCELHALDENGEPDGSIFCWIVEDALCVAAENPKTAPEALDRAAQVDLTQFVETIKLIFEETADNETCGLTPIPFPDVQRITPMSGGEGAEVEDRVYVPLMYVADMLESLGAF